MAGGTPATRKRRERPLIDAFYTELSFGTGGLRGKMGPGTNRINATTIGLATQGLANHLLEVHGPHPAGEPWRVAVACDSRNQSQEFAQITAEVLAANGFEAWIYPELRPTPQLSWTVRELGAVGGVVDDGEPQPTCLQRLQGLRRGWRSSGGAGGRPVGRRSAGLGRHREVVRATRKTHSRWTARGTTGTGPCLARFRCLLL